jgi:hypothetical protein
MNSAGLKVRRLGRFGHARAKCAAVAQYGCGVVRRRESGRSWDAGGISGFDAVLHAVASSFDDDGFGVVEESVEDGAGQGAVVVEDGRPVFEDLVGGQDDRAAFVALADDLEEEVGPAFVDGQVAQFVALC